MTVSMIIIKYPRTSILKNVAKHLRRGAVIVYPTDTAYGMGCDATNAKAVARIFKIKGRDKSKALPIICADQKMVNKYFLLTTHYSLLTKKHWPGPLSIVVKAKKGIAKAALERGTAAIRVPDSRIARTLSKFLGHPLIATSANISYQPTCYSIPALLRQKLKYKPDFILDSGALPHRRPSTIIKASKSGKIEVLRKGPITPSSFRARMVDKPRARNL